MAERPDTLTLLQRDAPQLQHVLDRAGVARDSMVVSFHPAPSVAPAADTSGATPQFMGTGQPHQGPAQGPPHRPPSGLPRFEPEAPATAAHLTQHAAQLAALGSIDITA